MPLSKVYVKTRNSFKVTFKVKDINYTKSTEIKLLGDFNDWCPEIAPVLKNGKDGFSIVKEMPAGASYEFRYLINGVQWVNDTDADGYVPSPFAYVDNCLVNLEEIPDLTKVQNADNFTKIEGIGPKISQVLIEAGFSTFEQLSTAKVSQLKSILALAGKRYQIHDPATWPKQSKLLSAGKIKELKKLQLKLKRGRA